MTPIQSCGLISAAVLVGLAGCTSSTAVYPRSTALRYPQSHLRIAQANVMQVQGDVSLSQEGSDWKVPTKNQLIGPAGVIRTGVVGAARLGMFDDTFKLFLFDSTTLKLLSLATDKTFAPSAEVDLELSAGSIRGEFAKAPPYSSCHVTTPNAVFFIPAGRETKFQISANGVAVVMKGVIAAVHIDPVTWKLTSFIVNAGQTFMPPLNPTAPGTPPTVRPTHQGEIITGGSFL